MPNTRTRTPYNLLALVAKLPISIPGLKFREDPPSELEGFKKALARHQENATALAEQLYTDNYKERSQNRQLNAEVAELKGKLPKEGEVVLSVQDAALWAKYKGMGTPEEVEKKITDGKAAADRVAQQEARETITTAAQVVGFKPSVLETLINKDQLVVSLEEVTVDGKPVKVAYVTGADKTKVALSDYSTKNWGDFLPSLKAADGGQGAGGGQPWADQGGGGAGAGGAGGQGGGADPAADFIKRRSEQQAKETNPLMATPKT